MLPWKESLSSSDAHPNYQNALSCLNNSNPYKSEQSKQATTQPFKMNNLNSLQTLPLAPNPLHKPYQIPQALSFPLKNPKKPTKLTAAKTQTSSSSDKGIPADEVRTLAKFRSLHNHIQVLEVSKRADHPFAGSRLLLLNAPGNIHIVSFLFRTLTATYFDVFATLPPILPPGPISILGFGAGSSARLLLHLYPQSEIHGWELDPSVISVGRKYFGLDKLEKQYPDNLFIYIADAFDAETEIGFSGILVDLFSKGRVVKELQEVETWKKLRSRLRRGGRVMVNCGGKCVESEDGRDGEVVMEETLEAMGRVFDADEVFVLRLGKEDSCVAFTGKAPDFGAWKDVLVKGLRGYVDMWKPLRSSRGGI